MSRIGTLPVAIPQGVTVTVKNGSITVEGPKGKLDRNIDPLIEIDVGENQVRVTRKSETKQCKALHGLFRSLINNMITGVSKGFESVLTINGVGYRAELAGKSLVLNLGYSNPIEYPIPPNISIELEANNRIVVRGINKEQLGQVCSEIRAFRPPEPYKGKGVKYEKETIKRKVGKTGVG
jgi:large subunit ribosomal protein L6